MPSQDFYGNSSPPHFSLGQEAPGVLLHYDGCPAHLLVTSLLQAALISALNDDGNVIFLCLEIVFCFKQSFGVADENLCPTHRN